MLYEELHACESCTLVRYIPMELGPYESYTPVRAARLSELHACEIYAPWELHACEGCTPVRAARPESAPP